MSDDDRTPPEHVDVEDGGPWVVTQAKSGRDKRLHTDPCCQYLHKGGGSRPAGPTEQDEAEVCAECAGENTDPAAPDWSYQKVARQHDPEGFPGDD